MQKQISSNFESIYSKSSSLIFSVTYISVKNSIIFGKKRNQAKEVAESIINRAVDEAARVKEGADVYAEDLLANLEQNLLKLQKEVKNGQIYIEKARLEANTGVSKIYPQQQNANSQNGNFVIE